MKKTLIIILCLCFFLTSELHSAVLEDDFKQEIKEEINNLFLDYDKSPDRIGLINEVNNEIIYLTNSQEEKLTPNTELIVTTQKRPIKDFLTGAIMLTPEYKIAEAKVISSSQDIIVAKVNSEEMIKEPQVGDGVVIEAAELNLAVIDFKYEDITKGIKEEVDNKLYNYFAADDRFEKIDRQQVNDFFAQEEIEAFNQAELEVVSREFGLDIIISGDIYLADDYLYVKFNFFDYKNNKSDTFVIEFSQEEEIIDYYLIRYGEQTPYQELFTSQKLDFAGYNIELINSIDKHDTKIIINTKDELKLLSYDEKLYRSWTIEQYQLGDYDDHKFVVTSDKIIAEKGNRLFQYEWVGDRYREEELENFFRNRPKNSLKKDGVEYLITRDFRNRLLFNTITEAGYEKDFSLELARNEGYRVEIADLDQNNEQDIILTAFDSEKEAHKILIYDLDYEFKYQFSGYYGPTLLATDLNQNQQQELFTISDGANQIISFIWDETNKEYKKNWESEAFEATIKDLAAGDLTNDGKQDLIVLLSDGEESWISLYQKNPYQKD